MSPLPCFTFVEGQRHHYRCTAFPDVVPDPILFSEHDHRPPYPDDQGVLYEFDADNALSIIPAPLGRLLD